METLPPLLHALREALQKGWDSLERSESKETGPIFALWQNLACETCEWFAAIRFF